MQSSKYLSMLTLLVVLLSVMSSMVVTRCRATTLSAREESALSDQIDGADSEIDAINDQNDSEDGEDPSSDSDEPKEAATNQIANAGLNEDLEDGAESNIANAKIDMTTQDLATASGHHHHHKHYPHGWLKMGAHTGKKGSFGWHSKHPVGGKGRR